MKELQKCEIEEVNGGWVFLAVRGIAAIGSLYGAGYTLGSIIADRSDG